jgi:phage baseplate assembly protein W
MNIRENTFGVKFPFIEPDDGIYLKLTKTPEEEIQANLLHLLLTKKGSRYYMPEFGTNLHQYIFEPLDDLIESRIEDEIIDAIERFLPNLTINKITIKNFYNDPEFVNDVNKQLSVTINIDYTINSRSFQSPGFVSLAL